LEIIHVVDYKSLDDTIEYNVFRNCSGLRSVTVPPNHSKYSSVNGALFNKDKTELIFLHKCRQGDFVIPDSVTKITYGMFARCEGITSVAIPDSIVEIEGAAFEDCNGLTSVIIPDSVQKTGKSIFSSCNNLASVSISHSLTKLEEGMFRFCKSLTSVTIPDSVTEIGDSVFSRTGLTSVIIPDSVVKIGSYAFDGCKKLKSVFIPPSVVEISDSAFNDCPAFITVHPDNPVYTSKRGKLTFKPVSGTIGELIEWKFANGVLTISGDGEIPAFDDCYVRANNDGRSPWYPVQSQIKRVIFKGKISIKSIHTFFYHELTSVTFPENCINKVLLGYTTFDVSNFNGWFCEQIPLMLQDLKRNTLYRPKEIPQQEWDAILDRIGFCFSETEKYKYHKDEEDKLYRENMKNEGFELFFKYFDDFGWGKF
jgi:hypothetical protein